MMKNFKFSKGFTLIELLIVISIIGILSTLLMANYPAFRQRARDGKRKSDIRQYQSTLEAYRADYGSYPTSIPACGSDFKSGDSSITYWKQTPCDPLGGDYKYSGTSTGYCIRACLENANDADQDTKNPGFNGNNPSCNTTANCDTGYVSFTLQNP